ncbi:polysaccharide biosynthesis tyrosine autokinase [Streptomyces sp. RB6PN25]|uniref:non-specific protein-tyrosine kinase n=1 Tax=Streptomyces humicola TaxID=2953240 RepID=A0ABT1PPT3_9ACTN|nr:polysaccharide biosynthesis tyrosine autokinase [Streptomyces humicola]MCQ4079698.1 polysaccharide biosynthesis tyrosine autokinase [Streptomyces humicola]
MDLRDYLRVLSRGWRLIAALTLLGAGLGVLATYSATPEYRASTTLFVSIQAGTDTSQLNQGNDFTQARVQSYAEMAASPLVTRPVVKALKLDMTPEQLARRITATAKLDTVLLRITVTDTAPRRASLISNAVAERFAEMVSGLERPTGAKVSPVKLSVTEPASAPAAPISPRPFLNLALGLLSGLALGVGCTVLRESLDTSVRTSQNLAAFLAAADGPPVLGGIVHDSRNSRQLVAARDDMHGLRAEGFRQLRTNLRFVEVDRPLKVIAVTSAIPGEGKTSVAVNLAATMAESGAKVCLVETDLRRPTASRALGLVPDAGLTTCLIGQAHVQQVLQSAGTFMVLTSGPVPPNPTELLGSEQFRTMLSTLSEEFDHIVIDTSPVLPVADTAAMAQVVDGYVLVVRAARTGRTQVVAALDALRRSGTPVLGTVLNMASVKGERKVYGYAYAYRPLRSRPNSQPFTVPQSCRRGKWKRSATMSPVGPIGEPISDHPLAGGGADSARAIGGHHDHRHGG